MTTGFLLSLQMLGDRWPFANSPHGITYYQLIFLAEAKVQLAQPKATAEPKKPRKLSAEQMAAWRDRLNDGDNRLNQ